MLVVVTNQPDVARGRQRREVVEAINSAVRVCRQYRRRTSLLSR